MRKLAAAIALLLGSAASTVAQSLTCTNGFTNTLIEIPPSKINDGYCDCSDGSDELKTDACSGSASWAGITTPAASDYKYKCPQQTLFLPISRLNDGICDCCDGSDENPGICSDICGSVLAQEREAMQKLLENFTVGTKRRSESVAEFRRVTEETVKKIESIRAQIPLLEQVISGKEKLVKKEKDEIVTKHFDLVHSIADRLRGSGGLDAVLKLDQGMLVEFIATSCQLFGEIILAESNNKYNRDKLCEPLRLAALDIGILWDGKLVRVKTGAKDDEELKSDIAHAFMANAGLLRVVPKEKIDEEWVDPEDAILDQLHNHDDDDRFDDEEPFDDDEYGNAHHEEHMEINKIKEEQEKEQKKDIYPKQHEYQFKTKFGRLMRATFHEQAEKVMSDIDDIVEEDDDEDGRDEKSGDSRIPPSVDPMAIQMVRNTLSRRMGQVEYGDELAQSAMAMLQLLEKSTGADQFAQDLENLAIGVIYHSKISEADVYEAVTVLNADAGADTCYSPYTTICSDTDMKGSIGQRCSKRKHVNFCEASDHSDLPTQIPDGYHNYYVPKARGPDDDYFVKTFETYEYNIFEKSNVPQLEGEMDEAQKEVENLKKDIKQLTDDIGVDKSNKDSLKFGINGELYAIRNDCFELKTGKYTYELCMFGRAYQREGSTKKGGTDLGTWHNASVDENSGSRILKWTGGSKCWNGPKRSATVFITCGAETQLISADEPNICEYEFRMESYLGCDEKFRAAHDF